MELRFLVIPMVPSLCARKIFLNTRQSTSGRSPASFDGLIRAIEVVPGERLNIRSQHQVRIALPDLQLMFLRCAHRAAHHLKDVRGLTAVAVLDSDRNRQYKRRAKIARRLRW